MTGVIPSPKAGRPEPTAKAVAWVSLVCLWPLGDVVCCAWTDVNSVWCGVTALCGVRGIYCVELFAVRGCVLCSGTCCMQSAWLIGMRVTVGDRVTASWLSGLSNPGRAYSPIIPRILPIASGDARVWHSPVRLGKPLDTSGMTQYHPDEGPVVLLQSCASPSVAGFRGCGVRLGTAK